MEHVACPVEAERSANSPARLPRIPVANGASDGQCLSPLWPPRRLCENVRKQVAAVDLHCRCGERLEGGREQRGGPALLDRKQAGDDERDVSQSDVPTFGVPTVPWL